jgi:uncharacterized protein (DUF2141 family)
MKSYSAVIVVLVFSLLSAQVKLEIKVEALESAEGNILLELMDENETTLKAIIQKIDSLPCIIEINDIENGIYGIKYFHDSNANGKMDFNWMGIPTEGFGFSNDAYGLFKPKKFKEWLFDISQDTMICLTPKYLNFP